MENDLSVTSEEIMFAIFDGKKEITDEVYEEVKKFAAFIKQQEGKNQ